MPAKLDRCVNDLMDQGQDESAAYAICTASIYPKPKDKKRKEPDLVNNQEPHISDYMTLETSHIDSKPKSKSKSKSKSKVKK